MRLPDANYNYNFSPAVLNIFYIHHQLLFPQETNELATTPNHNMPPARVINKSELPNDTWPYVHVGNPKKSSSAPTISASNLWNGMHSREQYAHTGHVYFKTRHNFCNQLKGEASRKDQARTRTRTKTKTISVA